MRQIVLDTETTGLSAEGGDRIIEIGCVELVARKLTGNNKHWYLNPERDSHEDALKVHGISNEFLRDKPKFAAIADELMEYVAGAEIIIHNAAFDVGFLNKELELIGRAPSPATWQGDRHPGDGQGDVPRQAQQPGRAVRPPGVDNSGRTLHGALLDAELLADVYINLTRGQDALLIDEADATAPSAASSRASTCASSRCRCCWPATRKPRRTRKC
jgi:DNA polymerase-3 subunit epsilon